MRQVRRDELIWNITVAMRHVTPALRNRLMSRDQEVKRMGDSILATIITDKALMRYEVLTDAPEGPPCPVLSEGTAGLGIGGTEG